MEVTIRSRVYTYDAETPYRAAAKDAWRQYKRDSRYREGPRTVRVYSNGEHVRSFRAGGWRDTMRNIVRPNFKPINRDTESGKSILVRTSMHMCDEDQKTPADMISLHTFTLTKGSKKGSKIRSCKAFAHIPTGACVIRADAGSIPQLDKKEQEILALERDKKEQEILALERECFDTGLGTSKCSGAKQRREQLQKEMLQIEHKQHKLHNPLLHKYTVCFQPLRDLNPAWIKKNTGYLIDEEQYNQKLFVCEKIKENYLKKYVQIYFQGAKDSVDIHQEYVDGLITPRVLVLVDPDKQRELRMETVTPVNETDFRPPLSINAIAQAQTQVDGDSDSDGDGDSDRKNTERIQATGGGKGKDKGEDKGEDESDQKMLKNLGFSGVGHNLFDVRKIDEKSHTMEIVPVKTDKHRLTGPVTHQALMLIGDVLYTTSVYCTKPGTMKLLSNFLEKHQKKIMLGTVLGGAVAGTVLTFGAPVVAAAVLEAASVAFAPIMETIEVFASVGGGIGDSATAVAEWLSQKSGEDQFIAIISMFSGIYMTVKGVKKLKQSSIARKISTGMSMFSKIKHKVRSKGGQQVQKEIEKIMKSIEDNKKMNDSRILASALQIRFHLLMTKANESKEGVYRTLYETISSFLSGHGIKQIAEFDPEEMQTALSNYMLRYSAYKIANKDYKFTEDVDIFVNPNENKWSVCLGDFDVRLMKKNRKCGSLRKMYMEFLQRYYNLYMLPVDSLIYEHDTDRKNRKITFTSENVSANYFSNGNVRDISKRCFGVVAYHHLISAVCGQKGGREPLVATLLREGRKVPGDTSGKFAGNTYHVLDGIRYTVNQGKILGSLTTVDLSQITPDDFGKLAESLNESCRTTDINKILEMSYTGKPVKKNTVIRKTFMGENGSSEHTQYLRMVSLLSAADGMKQGNAVLRALYTKMSRLSPLTRLSLMTYTHYSTLLWKQTEVAFDRQIDVDEYPRKYCIEKPQCVLNDDNMSSNVEEDVDVEEDEDVDVDEDENVEEEEDVD